MLSGSDSKDRTTGREQPTEDPCPPGVNAVLLAAGYGIPHLLAIPDTPRR